METTMEFTREVMDALGGPFPDDEVEFLPRGFYNGKARALAYIDARSVMRRLDAVVGPANWSFDFDVLSPDGKMVKGKLTVLGVTKCDAGEGDTEDEVLKSAVSDALKRCAVHFGIGRYLYYLPSNWAPFDQQKKRFIENPRLDPSAVARALAVCGVNLRPEPARGAYSRAYPTLPPAPETPKVAERRPSEPERRPVEAPRSQAEPERPAVQAEAPAAESETAPKRSIWASGGGTARTGAEGQADSRESSAVPESSGDRAAARPASRPAPSADTARSAPQPGSMVCSEPECGKALTKGQHDVSVRAYGQPLCPACQKQHARSSG